MRVLVIDDERPILAVIQRMLTPRGHEVCTAQNASEAFFLLATARCSFDVILCDVSMPKMDGWEFLARLGPLDAARLVVMTGGCRKPYDNWDVSSGRILMKPFDAETLVAELTEAARQS